MSSGMVRWSPEGRSLLVGCAGSERCDHLVHVVPLAVTGALKWRDHTRTYVLDAMTEDAAAEQGLRRFEDEIIALANRSAKGA